MCGRETLKNTLRVPARVPYILNTHLCLPSVCTRVCTRTSALQRDEVQLRLLFLSLNGLLMESNEGVLSRQMCPSATLFYPNTDPDDTSASKQLLLLNSAYVSRDRFVL